MKAGNLNIRWQYGSHNIGTVCVIKKDDDFVSMGMAERNAKDMHNKGVARKISMARALKNANLPKEERKVIWEIYRQTKPGGRW